MIPGENASATLLARHHLVALGWLRERILGQTAVDPRQGVEARHALLSLKHDCEEWGRAFAKSPARSNVIQFHPGSTGQVPGKMDGAVLDALDMLNIFERAIVESRDQLTVEALRLNCLDALDRLLQRVQPDHSGGV